METETGVGWIDAEGVVVLRVSTQVLEHFRDVADVLDLPHSRVRLEGAYLGGGFGGKEDVTVECLLGLLVWKTRRPVQLVFSREESFIGHGKRHPYVIRYRTGATRQGELTAIAAELISDSGAYAALSPWVLLYSLVTATGPYRVPNVARGRRGPSTRTIRSPAPTAPSAPSRPASPTRGRWMRSPPPSAWIRWSSGSATSSARATRSRTGQVLETEPMLAETMRRAWAALGPPRPGEAPRGSGRGLAASFTPYGRMCWTRDSASAWVGMELDGRRSCGCAAPDVGGGQTASLCSIVAEVLGLALDRRHRDGPRQPLHAARRDHHGHAAALHVGQRRAQGGARACARTWWPRRPRCSRPPRRTSISRAGSAFVRGTPSRAVPLANVVKAASAMGRPVQVLEKFDAPRGGDDRPETGQGKAFNDYTFGTQAVEVEVDEETGRVRATRIAACYDVGQMINRHSAEGQVEGGVIQGLGHALMEEVVLERGVSKNPHLFDYKIPPRPDAPPVEAILLESGQGLGPFGAKGIGEPAMTPTPAAVLNAVSDAVGRRITACPVTAERVLAALRRPE